MPESNCCQEDGWACGPFMDQEKEIEELRAALQEIADMPFSMVNDSESLRHSLRTIQQIALKGLATVTRWE